MEEEAAPGTQPGTLHAKICVSELTLSRGHLSRDMHGAGSQLCMQHTALPVPHARPHLPATVECGAEQWSGGAHPYPRGGKPGRVEGLVTLPAHSPEERQHPCTLAWPMAWVQPGGTRLLLRRYPGADLALSHCVSLGVGWGSAGATPLLAPRQGMGQCRWPQCCQGSHREVAAGFGKSWRGGRRVWLWGWAHLVQLTRGSLMEDRLHCTPSMQCRGFPCLSLLQCIKTELRA